MWNRYAARPPARLSAEGLELSTREVHVLFEMARHAWFAFVLSFLAASLFVAGSAQAAPRGELARSLAALHGDIDKAQRRAGTEAAVLTSAQEMKQVFADDLSEIARAQRGKKTKTIELNLGADRPVRIQTRRGQPRIGFLPIAGDPISFGHLSVALHAIRYGELDHVVLVPAGVDQRKPGLTRTEALRHQTVPQVLRDLKLGSLISYSPIARGTELDGETNFTRFLSANQNVPMFAAYMAGADHYNYISQSGSLDTLGKLSATLAGQSPAHEVGVLFTARDKIDGQGPAPTPPEGMAAISAQVIPATFSSSSTQIREALTGAARSGLVFLPSRAYRLIERSRLRGNAPYGNPLPLEIQKLRAGIKTRYRPAQRAPRNKVKQRPRLKSVGRR